MNEDYGFIRVAAASPRVRVADVDYNVREACSVMDEAVTDGVSLLSFPELNVTGYTCADLFGQGLLVEKAWHGLQALAAHTAGKSIAVVAGCPIRHCGRLYNCAAVIFDGQVRGLVPKVFLPTYNEFYESRWFTSGRDFMGAPSEHLGIPFGTNILFEIGKAVFAVEICEDLWTPVPPSSYHALAGAEIIVNPSASNEVLMKHVYRKDLVANQSARTISAYVYASSGYGESTQDLVFAGSSMIYENGSRLAANERFRMESSKIEADIDMEKLVALRCKQNSFEAYSPDGRPDSSYGRDYLRVRLGDDAGTDFGAKLLRHVEPHPFAPGGDAVEIGKRAKEITSIQVVGLASRLEHIGCKAAVIGISGGLDSTQALLVTAMAFDRLGWDRKRIIGVTMPGFGTTDRTHGNAIDLMSALGVTMREISIVPSVMQHFADIGQSQDVHDITYENCQARERTQILMDISNKEEGIVIGTGDLSELALGWCTYNGDHMSMYAVNSSIPKTLVRYLVRWAAVHRFEGEEAGGRSVKDILLDIADTPISPELTPADENGEIAQKTEDLVGPYELHDFFLYNFFRFGYSPSKVRFLAEKAFLQQENDGPVCSGPEEKRNTYSKDVIDKWLHKFIWRFFSQQFKRSCLPDGPKVGSVTLSPRGDWRMPSDAKSALWIADLDEGESR